MSAGVPDTSPPANGPDPEPGTAPGDSLRQRIGFWLGLAVFGLFHFVLELDPENPQVSTAAAVAALMAVWWMTEALHLAVTALVPVVLFPLLGVMKAADVAPAYVDSNIFLFAGGFVLALAMERWRLHRRIALMVLMIVGGRPSRIVLGIMIATGTLSMWVSNTATTMMMLPMALSLTALFNAAAVDRADGALPDPRSGNFPLALMLGVAYAASIGGMGTIIGTPPNVVLVSIFHTEFPGAPEITFARWFMFAAPLAVVFLGVAWVVLTKLLFPLPPAGPFSGRDYVRSEYRALGTLSREEAIVAAVFGVTALLWIFRKPIQLGAALTIPGWADFIPYGDSLDDGSVAMFAALALFILPARDQRGGGAIMDWPTAKRLPWEILILFGGGFALARGLTTSGLSAWIGSRFEFLAGAPPALMIGGISSSIVFLSELASNTAATQMVLPILASLARSLEVNPLLFMVPATISASCGFMLPVATPPNAIVYASGCIPLAKMLRAGLVLNLIGIVLAVLFTLTLALPIFGIVLSVFPEWAALP